MGERQAERAHMMTVAEFEAMYPSYAFNFSVPMATQLRVYAVADLVSLPVELSPIAKRALTTRVGRGRPIRNQTKTHYQCAGCERVLRNDFFQCADSQRQQNNVGSYCDHCRRRDGRDRKRSQAQAIARKRLIVWEYIAPRCSVCGFNKSLHALQMHHLGDKEALVTVLVTKICNPKTALLKNVQRMLSEASKCVPLCANCHAMVHSGEVSLGGAMPLRYNALELLSLLRAEEDSFQYGMDELSPVFGEGMTYQTVDSFSGAAGITLLRRPFSG